MENWLKENAPFVVADRQDVAVNPHKTFTASHPVLIINDDRNVLEIMAGRLEDAGYTVVAVTSGCEALQWIQAAGAVGELPALVLLDLALPGIYGTRVAEALHQLGRGAIEPIIVTSASRSSHLRI